MTGSGRCHGPGCRNSADLDFCCEQQHSAGVVVKVIPCGSLGKVQLTVSNLGPEPLERDEVARVLRSAASAVEQ